MSRLTEKHRFVPPIMHAFRSGFRERDSAKPIDHVNAEGERIIAGRRATPRSAISEQILRQELAEDLSILLNTVELAATIDLSWLDNVAVSILNFGVPDLTAIPTNSIQLEMLSKSIVAKLELFEPRLVPGTIKITQKSLSDDASGQIRFHISADMYSTPTDVAVEFVAEVETDSGQTRLTRP